MRRAVASRYGCSLLIVCLLAFPFIVATPSAQVPHRNVNMVTGGTFPGGDPFLQKQNEPSMAVSTRNPCHLLAGANDYRAVNLPGLPADKELGDAWVGWYESTDCGATWYSTLMPGYPQDDSPQGLASPMKGLSAAADPVVKAGPAGQFYYLFIAFNRGTNVGKLAVARAIDHNDRESFIDPDAVTDVTVRRSRSPIKYIDTRLIDSGSAGQFIDKPSLAVYPAATGTCTLDGESVPASHVYAAWTVFVGNSDENIRTKVYFARSADCGISWSPATKLTEGYPLNQGSVIAVNPRNPNDLYVVWRQVRSDRTTDAILYARSVDGGRSFTKAEYIPGLGPGQFAPFDQNTTSTLTGDDTITFRTVGYPAVAFSDEPPNGYLYLAVAQPLTPNAEVSLGGINSRIMLMRTDGVSWSSLTQAVPSSANGQQVMPALTYAAGKLQLIWYDQRFDESGLTNTPLIDEAQALGTQPRIRHTVDVLGAQASLPLLNWPPAPSFFQPYGVSQPDYNDSNANGVPVQRGPRLSQYLTGDPYPNSVQGGGARQLQFNFPNLLLYGGGTIPFMGDYIEVTGTQFVPDGTGAWVFNGLSNSGNVALSTFHASWTDNRDAGVPASTGVNVLGYTPPSALPPNVTLKNTSECSPDNTRTRDANVYTSKVTQDFSLTVPGNSKRTNLNGVVRGFAVQLTNGSDTTSTFTLSLTDPNASFSRFTFLNSYPNCGTPSLSPVHSITVNVLPKSSIARTVYVNCGLPASRRIVVTATRSDLLAASVVINPDPSTPGALNANGDPLGPESHNPDAENPDAENPDAENPDAENPDAENPDAENPDAENPDAENPDAENPDAENPDAENPDAENPDAENANFQDVSVDINNSGDTTSSYQIQVQASGSTAGYQFLLLGNRVYATPTSINCYLVRRRSNQQLFAVPNPDLTLQEFPPENDPNAIYPTVLIRPGESIRLTLRAVWDSAVTTTPFCSTDPNDPNYCFRKLTFRAKAQAPNTGETEPREVSIGGRADIVTEGALTSSETMAGIGGFVDSPGATIRNAGFVAAGRFSWGAFLTTGEGNTYTGTIDETTGLAPGATIPSGPMRVRVPFSTGIEGEVPFPPGSYFFGLLSDAGNTVEEANEENNMLQSATAITVVDYRSSIVPAESVTTGAPFSRSVNVRGPGGAAVPGATVTLSLEGPNARDNVPGPPATLTGANLVAMTNSDGVATFDGLSINTAGANYRLIATVEIPGVGVLKFMSLPFSVVDPGPRIGN